MCEGVYLDSTTDFMVDASSVEPKAEGLVRALITSPSGTLTEAIVKNQQNGLYHCLYTPTEQGFNTSLFACLSCMSACFRTIGTCEMRQMLQKCLFCGNASARELAKKYMLIIYADYA